MNASTLIALLLCTTLISGCSLFTETADKTSDWTAQQLYAEAKGALQEGDNATAIKHYELLEARFPFGRYAQQAQMDIIYAYYKYDELESALVAADRFIKLYPRHPHVDYVYYIKGLINFEKNAGFIDRMLPLDQSQRDQRSANTAFNDFNELLKRFPDSKYSEDARLRMLYLRNSLAQYEVNVARFYMVRGAYVAAVNRAKKVVESYQRTPAVPEALVVMAKAYKVLGMNDLSADALRVLKLNFPDNAGIAEVETLVVKP